MRDTSGSPPIPSRDRRDDGASSVWMFENGVHDEDKDERYHDEARSIDIPDNRFLMHSTHRHLFRSNFEMGLFFAVLEK